MQLLERLMPATRAVSTPDGTDETERAATITAHVHAICTQLDALDQEIADLDAEVATLPATLAALARHPVLWLLLGREGVDRPGSLGTLVGQQVVTVTRMDRRALLLVAMVMLLIGLAIGIGLSWWYGGIR